MEGTPFVWKERHLFEGKVLLTKKKIESAASFESYTMTWKYVTILSITPFLCKYVTALYWDRNTIYLKERFPPTKNIILHPQRLHTWKGKLHIPKEYWACLAYMFFFLNNDLTRMPWARWIGFGLDYCNLHQSGLILRNQKPKETKTKTKKTKKPTKTKKKSRLVWLCLDPSSPQHVFFLFYFHSKLYFH